GESYLLWLKPPTEAQLPSGWKGWLAKTFQAPVFVMLPFRIFNNPNDIKLLESMLRRKNLIA
ncbi:hypothetical protein ACPWRG_22835, partial [Pandoraea pneumonica]|uniref:hypothetical protein n=2 Tax=Pseudomonadati TaxID=3379134 RepID=UPI003CF4B512